MGRSACMVLAMALTLGAPAFVAAQDDEEEGEASEAEAEAPPDEADPEAGDDSGEGVVEPAAEAASDDGPRKFYFGIYLRYLIVPSFVLRMFLDEAPTVSNFAPGGLAVNIWNPEDGGPSFQIGIGYSSYSFDGPFRATGDPAVDTEYLHSTLGLVNLTGSILWNTPIIDDVLTFEYGLGIDFGIVTGSLIRNEARYDMFSRTWIPCRTKNDPNDPLHTYCGFPSPPTLETNTTDMNGEHYNVKANVPPVFAFPLLPHLALRYEPMDGLAFKFETGLFPVFWLGLSAAYAPF
jgi:hypothetical protein